MLKVLPRLLIILIVGAIILLPDVVLASHLTITIPRFTMRRTGTPIPTSTTPSTSSGPTATPTATPSPITKPSATTTPQVSSSSNTVQNYILNRINDYRRSQGLSSVQTSQETCDFAKIRAKEISTSFNHDGFRNRINSKTIPYARWSMITENIAMTSNYQNVVNMWINSTGHAENMRKDTPYVCVEANGNYYAYEGMRP